MQATSCRLCTESPEDMGRLLAIVADFRQWSGMRVKLQKSVASALDFAGKEELSTGGVLLKGALLVHLPADASFCDLDSEVRASILTAGGHVTPKIAQRQDVGLPNGRPVEAIGLS